MVIYDVNYRGLSLGSCFWWTKRWRCRFRWERTITPRARWPIRTLYWRCLMTWLSVTARILVEMGFSPLNCLLVRFVLRNSRTYVHLWYTTNERLSKWNFDIVLITHIQSGRGSFTCIDGELCRQWRIACNSKVRILLRDSGFTITRNELRLNGEIYSRGTCSCHRSFTELER